MSGRRFVAHELIARLPLFDAMRLSLQEEDEEIAERREKDPDD